VIAALPNDDDLSALQREALGRVRRLVSGEATIADVEDAKRWQAQSPKHAEAFAFASRLWGQLGPAGQNVLMRSDERLPVAAHRATSYRPSRRLVIGGALAACAAYAVVRPPLQLWPSMSEFAADYRTAVGEQRRVALADGASMELNTRTSVALRTSGEAGNGIELIDGEALIDTGGDLSRPLIVIAGNGRVSATGARFNVRYDGATSCITCIAGEIDIHRLGATERLAARQQYTYGARGIGAAAAADPVAATAWQDGLLVFQRTPLAAVVDEINRYRPGKIVLMNARLGERTVNARFRVQNVDEIMTLAQQVFGAKVTSLPGGLVILS
jgi:transmembrane sensor